jgi:hypothetical protein
VTLRKTVSYNTPVRIDSTRSCQLRHCQHGLEFFSPPDSERDHNTQAIPLPLKYDKNDNKMFIFMMLNDI